MFWLMKEKLIKFILENNLSPFNSSKSLIRNNTNFIYKTRDAKAIHSKVLLKISSNFIFSETSNLWNCFNFSDDINIIKQGQEFFKSIVLEDSEFLKEINKPRITWKPRYDIVAVTENESTFIALNELGCGTQLLVSENDVMELERYDIVQVVDCSDFQILLERLPQSVFVDSVEDVYLERHLEKLSGWRENFAVLNRNNMSKEMKNLLKEIEPMFNLLENKEGKIITESEVEKILDEINGVISKKIKEMTISGEG